jgi:spore maturation protein CgeB
MTGLHIAVFGLSVSSAWGNGHATLWRGLIAALDALGHSVVFFEKDVPYYAAHRDLHALPGRSRLVLYRELEDVEAEARAVLRTCDAAMVTSYCPDAHRAAEWVLASGAACRAFYDLDTPVTLERARLGEDVPYVPPSGLAAFDLVLSYTGGRALDGLRRQLGARNVVPLYGSVDPDVHRPAPPKPEWISGCSYLGTYSADRQEALDALFLAPARARADLRFVLGGSMYPEGFPWSENLWHVAHVAPGDHPSFYGSAPITVSVTRRAFAELGHCPSGRLFEAAACGTPVLSDRWEGIDAFFRPGSEILLARTTEDALSALALDRSELAAIGRRARERTLDEHNNHARARELIAHLEQSGRRAADVALDGGAS